MISEITLAGQEDFETVMNLYRAAVGEEGCAWSEDYPNEDDIRRDIERASLYCARNECGEIISAFAIDSDEEVDGLPCWTPALAPAGEVARLVVGRKWQNRGIARQMLIFAMEELRRRGCRGIHFLVSKTNERALRSYGKLDFEKVGEADLYGLDWYCYEKTLVTGQIKQTERAEQTAQTKRPDMMETTEPGALTEREKMGRQMLYDANYDETLIREREAAKALCHAYNQLEPCETAKQKELMGRILGKTKGSFFITAPFWCDYGYNIEIGENFYANHNLVILDGAKVIFGDNVFVAPDCGFHTAGHPIDYERRNQGLEYAYPITVGDNVWIGAGVQVMPGVTIGSNVVIGGGSVVVKDIPDNSVAVGNPCRVIRPITEEDRKTCYDRNPEHREDMN